jgi:ornithine carbamoyltransferase
MLEPQHFLDLSDFKPSQLGSILASGRSMKDARHGKPQGAREPGLPLNGRLLAMIFERPSTRTRVSFDVAMRQMGGETIILSAHDMQLGRGETIADTARVLSRYVDAVMIRATSHEALLELARHSTVPVINGLTDRSHPCQIMADLLTLQERKGKLEGLTVAWCGDSCNVTNSWIHAAGRFGFSLRIASPAPLQPAPPILQWASRNKADVSVTVHPREAVAQADCVIADTWVSMNVTDSADRHNLLKPFQVDGELMKLAKTDAVFMHCLPAHRGEEVTAAVIDGPQSIVFDEAENRLHIQKSILAFCLNQGR